MQKQQLCLSSLYDAYLRQLLSVFLERQNRYALLFSKKRRLTFTDQLSPVSNSTHQPE